MSNKHTRREFLGKSFKMTSAALLLGNTQLSSHLIRSRKQAGSDTIVIDPQPLFDLSPYFYMQFMEPLGVTDGSVEAAWDYDTDDWRGDLITTVRDLAPDVIRWGGNFSRFYKWREAVGPVKERPWMYNYAWGGKETNRVGTHEFVNFCRKVDAEPLMVVNFMSDGRKAYWNTVHGENRMGDAKEAADWVSYANDPDHRERIKHGIKSSYGIKLWQVGNETSYLKDGFTIDEAVNHTVEFAQAMKQQDPSIKIIGWGDWNRDTKEFWTSDMIKGAGESLDYIAMHMMGMRPIRKDTVLKGFEYQREPEKAWEELIELSKVAEAKLKRIREIIDREKTRLGLAVTEGHLSLDPHNSNTILQEWLSAVYHSRLMNIYQRNGDLVKICTGADFCGTRWTVNAVMIPVPRGKSFLMPVGSIMRLFKKCNGNKGVRVVSTPADLDVAASCSENKIYLHVVNLNYHKTIEAEFRIQDREIKKIRIYEIAPDNPRDYVDRNRTDTFIPKEKYLNTEAGFKYRFPKTSVSAVEIELSV